MRQSFTLVYGDQHIAYEVKADPRKSSRVAIHVNPDGSVSVDAPPDYPEEGIRQAVQKRARWISSHVIEARDRFAHVSPRAYVSGEQVLYLGRRYVLKVVLVAETVLPIKLKGNQLVVETRTGDPDDIRGKMRGWYRCKARDYFVRRLEEFAANLPWVEDVPPLRLLNMSRQWGSCSPQGQVILNPHLIKAPLECVEYVMIHELAHLKRHDHSAGFYDLVNRHAPGWKKAKSVLDQMVEVLAND